MTAKINAASVTPAMDDHSRTGSRRPSTANSDGLNQGMRVLSTLIAGVLLYGALGWLGDHLLSTGFLLPLGIVLGAAFGAYTSISRLNASLKAQSVVGSTTVERGDR